MNRENLFKNINLYLYYVIRQDFMLFFVLSFLKTHYSPIKHLLKHQTKAKQWKYNCKNFYL